MPPGTPFNAFALPYRIRVDAFTQLPPQDVQPSLYLLTHTHTDHVNGLASKSFGSVVYCSQDAKEMLLKHESFMERELYHEQLKPEKTRMYSHLKVVPATRPDGSQCFIGARDLLKPLPLNTPTTIELEHGEEVTLTLVDANHCPGAVMYLIEGREGTILHTGDFRAEPWFLDNLARNPFLQPYIAPLTTRNESFFNKTLDAIYLDTACAFSTLFVPTKEQATNGLVELIKLFPHDTHFFINAWTWGYEDILKSIARAFQCQIHVDRYKYSIYQRVSDPYLRSILTTDADSTRFHACERFRRCDYVAVADGPADSDIPVKSRAGKRVVYINPVTMAAEGWKFYQEDTNQCLRTGEIINSLLVPLARHSPLPELQAFVRLFRPRRVIPNTLDPRLRGSDWISLDRMFENCLSPLVTASKIPATPKNGSDLDLLTVHVEEEGDAAVKNIIGSSELVLRWADKGKLRDKLEIMIGYLDPERKTFLDKLLKVRPPSPPLPVYASKLLITSPALQDAHVAQLEKDSEDGSDDGASEDDHWKAAHCYFGASMSAEGEQYSKILFCNDTQDDAPEITTASPEQRDQQHIPPSNTRKKLLMTPPTSPVLRSIECIPAKSKKLCSGKKRTRDDSDHLTPPRSKRCIGIESHRLATPIHIPTTSSSANKAASKYTAIGQSDHNHDIVLRSNSSEPLTLGQYLMQTIGAELASGRRAASHGLDENIFTSDTSPADIPLRRALVSRHSPKRASASSAFHVRRFKEASAPTRVGQTSETISRLKRHLEKTRKSLELADKLVRANPGRVAPAYREDRARLLRKCAKSEVETQYLEALQKSNVQNVIPDPHFSMEEYETVEGSQLTVDWTRSEGLAQQIRVGLAKGKGLGTVIPPLVCTGEAT